MTPPPSLETVDRVIGILGLYVGPRHIDPRASLRGDLGLDWIDRQGIACELAELFGFDVPDGVLADWETVEDIAVTVDEMATRR